jgi:hypothetical protein
MKKNIFIFINIYFILSLSSQSIRIDKNIYLDVVKVFSNINIVDSFYVILKNKESINRDENTITSQFGMKSDVDTFKYYLNKFGSVDSFKNYNVLMKVKYDNIGNVSRIDLRKSKGEYEADSDVNLFSIIKGEDDENDTMFINKNRVLQVLFKNKSDTISSIRYPFYDYSHLSMPILFYGFSLHGFNFFNFNISQDTLLHFNFYDSSGKKIFKEFDYNDSSYSVLKEKVIEFNSDGNPTIIKIFNNMNTIKTWEINYSKKKKVKSIKLTDQLTVLKANASKNKTIKLKYYSIYKNKTYLSKIDVVIKMF